MQIQNQLVTTFPFLLLCLSHAIFWLAAIFDIEEQEDSGFLEGKWQAQEPAGLAERTAGNDDTLIASNAAKSCAHQATSRYDNQTVRLRMSAIT